MGSADPPRPVVVEVLRALGRRATVVPGRNGRLLTLSLALVPRPSRTRVMGRVMGRMAFPSPLGR